VQVVIAGLAETLIEYALGLLDPPPPSARPRFSMLRPLFISFATYVFGHAHRLPRHFPAQKGATFPDSIQIIDEHH
jgi:hypothetical protein